MIIHTVTLTNLAGWSVHDADPADRCCGFYPTRGAAKKGLHKHCDSEAEFYTHAVIEKLESGMFMTASNPEWFRWNRRSHTWKKVGTPRGYANTTNFGIG